MIKVFGFTHGNNGVSMYRTWQPLDNLNKADFKVKRVPNRSEKIHWPNMTDEPNVPGLGSYAEIIEKNDIIFSNFKSADADCAMLCIAAKLKKVVVDIDDDILHMPTDNNNYKHWFNPENGTDYWAEIEPDDMENCQKWEKEGRGLILTNPQTKKLCFVVVRKHPWENVIQE